MSGNDDTFYQIRLKCPKCAYTTIIEDDARKHLEDTHPDLAFIFKDWQCCQMKVNETTIPVGKVFRLVFFPYDVEAETSKDAMMRYEREMSKPHTMETVQLNKKGKPLESTRIKLDWGGDPRPKQS